jgi:hypothetical protein
MGIKSTAIAAAAAAIIGLPASAAVIQSSTRVLEEDGGRLGFEFHNIEQYAGTGAYFTISTGSATTGAADGSDDGLDLDGEGRGGRFEFMKVSVDGWHLGKYSCGTARTKHIAGATMNGPADCQFSLRFDFKPGDFAEIAENGLEFILNFGAGVGAFDDGDEITVALNLDSTPPIAQAPLPASALLLLGGLGAAGFASRRRKNKS